MVWMDLWVVRQRVEVLKALSDWHFVAHLREVYMNMQSQYGEFSTLYLSTPYLKVRCMQLHHSLKRLNESNFNAKNATKISTSWTAKNRIKIGVLSAL